MTGLTSCPVDLLQLSLGFLEEIDIYCVSMVSKRMFSIARSRRIWVDLYQRHFFLADKLMRNAFGDWSAEKIRTFFMSKVREQGQFALKKFVQASRFKLCWAVLDGAYERLALEFFLIVNSTMLRCKSSMNLCSGDAQELDFPDGIALSFRLNDTLHVNELKEVKAFCKSKLLLESLDCVYLKAEQPYALGLIPISENVYMVNGNITIHVCPTTQLVQNVSVQLSKAAICNHLIKQLQRKHISPAFGDSLRGIRDYTVRLTLRNNKQIFWKQVFQKVDLHATKRDQSLRTERVACIRLIQEADFLFDSSNIIEPADFLERCDAESRCVMDVCVWDENSQLFWFTSQIVSITEIINSNVEDVPYTNINTDNNKITSRRLRLSCSEKGKGYAVMDVIMCSNPRVSEKLSASVASFDLAFSWSLIYEKFRPKFPGH